MVPFLRGATRGIASLGCEGECAPSPQACRHASPSGRAPHRYSVPQPQAA